MPIDKATDHAWHDGRGDPSRRAREAVKVWRLHIQGETGAAVTVEVPYRDGEAWRIAGIPAHLIPLDRWLHVTAVGPLEVPPPDWWPRQLAP